MLITDRMVFVELQKTGSTQFKGLLRKLVGGDTEGKSTVPLAELVDSGRKFVALVSNPWSWYLQLWSFGCLQKGELYERLTNEKKWGKLLEAPAPGAAEADAEADAAEDAAETAGEEGDEGKAQNKGNKTLPPNFTPDRARSFWYADPDNAEAFREWLQAVLATRPLRKVLDGGYGKSPLNRAGGLMTYRYFTLCTRNGEKVDKEVSTFEALNKYDADNCFIDYFVRNESLSEDLIKAMDGCGIELDDTQKKQIRGARKTAASNRPHGPEHYYDKTSIQLVARRERFIVEKFSYKNAKP